VHKYIHAHTHTCSNTRTHTHKYSYTHRSTSGERSRSRRRYKNESKRSTSTSRNRRSNSRSKQDSEPTKRRIEHLLSKSHGGRYDRLCYFVEGHAACLFGLDCNYEHSKRELELCRKTAIVKFPALGSMHYATVGSVKDFGAFFKLEARPTDALLHVSDFDEARGGPGQKICIVR